MAIEISKAELEMALAALGEVGASVYSAHREKDGTIVLNLVGRSAPLRYKPPASEPKVKPARREKKT